MAIIDVTTWVANGGNGGVAPTGADATAAAAICAAVSEALTRMAFPILLEPTTLTLAAFDAPTTPVLLLPRPIRAITALHVVSGSNGDSSECDASNLLTNYVDYTLDIDDVVNQVSRTGRVYRRPAGTVWGWETRRPIGDLAYAVESEKRVVYVSGTFGPAAVSAAVQLAASSAVSLLYGRRKTGVPLNNESWNGYSYGNSSAFTATDALNSPDVRETLRAAGCLPIHIG